ncbi:MAG: hypothetical protein JNM63_06225 [Spirochaetia bacterium]|nr:hypothetical protein [Spirochaetia bacterium]
MAVMNAAPLSRHPVYLKIEALLSDFKKREPRLEAYEITVFEKRSEQRLLFGMENENGLDVSTARYDIFERSFSVQIYTRTAVNSMGLASSQIDPMGDLKKQLQSTFEASLATANPAWDLPLPAPAKKTGLRECDPALVADLRGGADRLVLAADAETRKLSGVHVNYAELFVNHTRFLHRLSTGIQNEREITDLYFEIAMEKLPLPNTQEVHNNVTSVDEKGLALPEFIRRTAEEARSLGEVSIPETSSETVILLGADDLNILFHTLLAQLDRAQEYYARPFIREGEWISRSEPAGDPLTLRLDPHLDFMAESRVFSGEGIPTTGGTLVEKSRVAGRTSTHRIARYLGLEADGVSGNVVVNAGSRSKEELLRLAPRVIEVKAFSSLLSSGDSLTWSSEIKFAVEHRVENGVATKRYLKGGVLSGNLRENLQSLFFSRETEVSSRVADSYHAAMGYVGPAWALILKGVSLSGK